MKGNSRLRGKQISETFSYESGEFKYYGGTRENKQNTNSIYTTISGGMVVCTGNGGITKKNYEAEE